MAETLNILIPYGYVEPTSDDVNKAKNYVLKRESAARSLSSLIDALMKDAAAEITKLCFKYNISPKDFQIASSYNKELFEQVAEILDNLEEEILDLVLDYSTKCAKDEDRKSTLWAWILLLGHDNRNLRQTLEDRLKTFSRDIEAMIVATKLAKYDVNKAVTRIKSNLHTVYVMPEMKPAFANASLFKAENIRSKGVKHGNFGNSNSESNNIDRFAVTTLQMAWMRNQAMDFKESGAVGYLQLRGSSYPCSICDGETGFHSNIDEIYSKPLPHPHCVCYRVPVYNEELL